MEEQPQQALIPLIKYLYNTGYAEIDVSQECRDKYKELYNEKLDEDIMGCRTNPKLIKVFELLGSKKCSGSPSCIRLAVRWIAKEMEPYIAIYDYDGQENVYTDYNNAFADVLHELMKHNCECTRQFNFAMSGVGSSVEQCDCIPQDAVQKYQRINYIKSKMNMLHTRKINEAPDATIFSYEI
jgi:hypothetical protein